MKKNLKKVIAMLIAAVMLFSAMPVSAADVVEGVCGENGDFNWELNLNTGVLTVSGEGVLTKGEAGWDEHLTDIQYLDIKEGITEIGDDVFSELMFLRGITIPEGVTSIGYFSFGQCLSLESAELPESLKTIGDGAFAICMSLDNVVIPEGVTSIGSNAFANCQSAKNIEIRTKDAEIGEMAFGYIEEYVDETRITVAEFMDKYRQFMIYEINGEFEKAEELTSEFSDCLIHFDEVQVMDGVTLYGYAGSTTKDYAVDNNIPFAVLEPCNDHIEVTCKDIEPTCTKTGRTGGTWCDLCCEILSAPTTIEAKGHTSVAYEEIEATCTEDGRTGGSYCEVCGEETAASTVVKAKGHTSVPYEEIEATCTEDGRTGGTYCETCGEETAAPTVIEAKGHTSVPYEEIEATCIEAGRTGGTYCEACGTVLTAPDVVLAKGHSYGEWAYDYDNMLRTAECTACGDKKSEALEKTDNGDVEIIEPEDPDTDFEVEEVEKNSDKYVIVEEALKENIGSNDWSIVRIFDITLKNKDGIHVQPDGTVKVKLPHDWKHNNYKVYRINDDGTLTDMNAYRQGSHIVFETDHFSLYVIVDESPTSEEPGTEPDVPETPDEEPEEEEGFMAWLKKLVDSFKNLIEAVKNFFRSIGRHS